MWLITYDQWLHFQIQKKADYNLHFYGISFKELESEFLLISDLKRLEMHMILGD